ncbi:hypothetical protein XENOCAPTIV_000818 [Xenoophorus captivus]|uniref:Uncharacterized protein n=1 Tax=Xenoophorus captivus TaxID=1517983 RepID=A0ABV0RW54_9TELE
MAHEYFQCGKRFGHHCSKPSSCSSGCMFRVIVLLEGESQSQVLYTGFVHFCHSKIQALFKHFLGKFQTFPAPNFGAVFISVRLFFIELYDHITRRSLCEGNLSTI